MRYATWIVIAVAIIAGALAWFWNYGRTDHTHFDPVMSEGGGGVASKSMYVLRSPRSSLARSPQKMATIMTGRSAAAPWTMALGSP